MIRIAVDVGEAQRRLNFLRMQLHDTEPLMNNVAGIMLNSTKENFAAGGRPAWLKSARVKLHGGKTLMKSNVLFRSIQVKTGRGYALVGTNIKYAAIHQFGGDIRRRGIVSAADFRPFDGKATKLGSYSVGGMPARPFLLLTDQDKDLIRKAAADYLADK